MSEYRIFCDEGGNFKVQSRLPTSPDIWRTVFHCTSLASAESCLKRCRERASEFASMSEAERRAAILREQSGKERSES